MSTTAVPTSNAQLTTQQVAIMLQYTVEAYKTFEKLASSLPNPLAARMFSQFQNDERANRDLIDMKAAEIAPTVKVTLGSDRAFGEVLEGELSFREVVEFLIARERTMAKRLREFTGSGVPSDRNLLVYLETVKRSHVVELERELELLKFDADWWKREDAEWRIVHGAPEAR
ncbi:MAG: hypothetical protein WA208_18280 [Thermoanaerobaculia bacterium]